MQTDFEIKAKKSALRAKLKDVRNNAYNMHLNHCDLIVRHFALPIMSGQIIAGYYPFGTEINVLPLLEALESQGAKLCLPRINHSNKEISFHKFAFGDRLETSGYGINEPLNDTAILTPEIVLVPLLGFDKNGNRLGYGKGYYDKIIVSLRKDKKSIFIGVAFSEQEVTDIPCHTHDQKLDYILNPDGFRAFSTK